MKDFLAEMPYDSDNFIVLDFETTNTSFGTALSPENSIVLSVWNRPANPTRCDDVGGDREKRSCFRTHVQWGNEYTIGELISDIERADFLVCHNAKFELQWLARAGLDLDKVKVFDTMVADYVLHGGLSVPLGLGPVAGRYGLSTKEPYIDKCIKGRVCPSELPRSMLERRCIYDVNVTHELFLRQRERLRETGQLSVMWTRCILTPVLADIERNGMALDHDRVNTEYERTLTEFNAAYRGLVDITGGINLNSAKQRGEYIYETLGISELKKRGKPERTAAGGYKTDKDTILRLKGKNKQQKEFLTLYAKYAKLNAKLTKSLNTYKQCIDNNDLLYAQFNQTNTKTQRLSSSGAKYSIQFQNQPREYKSLFCARDPDYLVAEIDGAQLEFRVAAFLGQDKTAVDAIRNKFDVHKFTASVLNKCEMEEVTKDQRQDAKADTFKPLYGGQSGTEAQQEYYKAFRDRYPGIAAVQQAWIDEALATQQVRAVNGLIYYFPGTSISRGSGYVTNTTSICNYPVQGLATAEIIPIALTYLWHELRKRKLRSFIVNTIHDSAIMEVHKDELEEVQQIAVDCFTHAVYNYLKVVYNIEFNVPLGTGFKAGTHWSEGEEIEESVEPPLSKL